MYGNTVRVGAFTEIVHVMSVFVSIFTLLILSQMCYIYLPRVDVTVPPTSASLFDPQEEQDTSGPFDINLMSLLIATAFSTVCCCLFTLGLEILTRSVKSRQKSPGNAYYSICENEIRKVFRKDAVSFDHEEHKIYFIRPLFLRFKNTGLFRDEIDRYMEKPMKERNHTEEVALYIKQLLHCLQIENKKYFKKLDVLKKIKAQKVFEEKMSFERENLQESERVKRLKAVEEAMTVEFPTFSQTSWSKLVEDKRTQEKEKFQKKMDMLNVLKSDKEITIAFPRFSYIWSSESYSSEDCKSSESLESFHSSASYTGKKLTYLDVLKQKVLSRTKGSSNNAVGVKNESDGTRAYSYLPQNNNRNYNSTVSADSLKSTVEYFENTAMQENLMFETDDKCCNVEMSELECVLDKNVNANVNNIKSTTETEEDSLNDSIKEKDGERSEICSVELEDDEEFSTGIQHFFPSLNRSCKTTSSQSLQDPS